MLKFLFKIGETISVLKKKICFKQSVSVNKLLKEIEGRPILHCFCVADEHNMVSPNTFLPFLKQNKIK